MSTVRPSLVVIVGAGVSVACGAPTTKSLLDVVLNAMPTEKMVVGIDGKAKREPVSIAKALRDALLAAHKSEPDFELVMAAIEELLSYGYRSGPLVSAISELQSNASVLSDTGLLLSSYSSGTTAIVQAFTRGVCSDPHQAAHASLQRFFKRLAAEARLSVATLNYDNLLDGTLPWFDGFLPVAGAQYAEFNPGEWLKRTQLRDSHLMMHLHGSVRFGFRPITASHLDTPFGEPVLYPTPEDAALSTANRSVGVPTVDGFMLAATPIIAGGHKSPKLMHNARPYAYYNATVLQEVAASSRLLVIGYGFRDAHVNTWIDEYMRLNPAGKFAFITRRSGRDVNDNTSVERFLMRISRHSTAYNFMYEPVEGGAKSDSMHGRVGRSYLVTSGVPMDNKTEEAMLSYLFDKEPVA